MQMLILDDFQDAQCAQDFIELGLGDDNHSVGVVLGDHGRRVGSS